jgi:short-subunit dehydrogenase
MTRPTPGVAVVTGAGRGIGAAIAARLSERGHHVVVTDVDEAAAADVAGRLPGTAEAHALDVRDPEAHRRVAALAAAVGPPVRVWVNNAGILVTRYGWEYGDAEVEAQVAVNLTGVVHGCRAALDVMEAGDVLCMASMSAHIPVPGLALYGATKAAVLRWCTALDAELRHAGRPIRVRALCPDPVRTDMVAEAAEAPQSALLFTGGRLLSTDRVAAAAVGLLDGSRAVRTMPLWRGAMLRALSVAPTPASRLLPALSRMGDRRRRAFRRRARSAD